MVGQSGRGRIFLITWLAALALLALTFWMSPEPSLPGASTTSVALPSERTPESPPPPAATPVELSPSPSIEPLRPYGIAEPSSEKRKASADRTPAEARVKEIVEGYPDERAAILAVIEKQSVEETVASAPAVWPSDAFTVPHGRGVSPIESQKYLLQDPRLAKILHVALRGDMAQRETVLSIATRVVSDIVIQKQKRQWGEEYDASVAGTGPGIGVYPIIMAELDANGETLPLLLDWYDAERGPVKGEAELSSLRESMGLPPARPGVEVVMPMTGNMFLIASAAQRISANIGQPLLSHEELGRAEPGRARTNFPGSGWDVDIVDELAGYALLDEYNPLECEHIMDALRQRLYSGGR